MSTTSIPVDLLNPGQVFAALGFLEAANALCSGAGGWFDWTNPTNVLFKLHVDGGRNPFETVLDFLSNAQVRRIVPKDYKEPPPNNKPKKDAEDDDEEEEEEEMGSEDLEHSDWFPSQKPDIMTFPVRLTNSGQSLDITHWADGSSRNKFKLYAGNRSAAGIARAMLMGTRKKPGKGQQVGDLETKGIRTLWNEDRVSLAARPFDVLTPMGGSFNFDPRGAWTGIDAGYSPNTQKHGIASSPVVELLAAIGLENARPQVDEDGKLVRYAAWGELLGPLLARPALAGFRIGVPLRMFSFKLVLSGKNKVVNFAEGEI